MIEPRKHSFQQIPFWALRGKFREQGWYDNEIAEECGIGVGTMTTRMQGKSAWRADEISRLCEVLEIPQEEVGRYFFPDVAKRERPAVAGTPTSLKVTG